MRMSTVGANLGNPFYTQIYTGTEDTVNYNTTDVYGSGLNVSYNVAMRNTSSAINGAADGTSFTENATPTNLVDLSSQTLEFGRQGDTSGTLGTHTIALFRQDDNDWTDTGIEEAST